VWSSRWNVNWQRKPKHSEETFSSETSQIPHDLTWTVVKKLATNLLSYGAASYSATTIIVIYLCEKIITEIQVLAMLHLSDNLKKPRFHHVCYVDIRAIFHLHCVDMLMICLRTKLHTLSPSVPFIIVFKSQAKNSTARHIVFILHSDFITSNYL
jgi:hypothetical protein